MAPKIRLGDNAVYGPELITESIGVIGMKGSGKTHTAMVLVEEMHRIGAQVVALDPVGNHWSLRLASNGKDKGLDIPVFGGAHGDIPLDINAGAFVARTLVEKGWSAVIDVSRFRKAQRKRFATDFAEELFELKKDNISPLHLVLEEARYFLPQKPEDGHDPRMLGVFQELVRTGRNYGIGTTLIDQRPASVSKDAFSQVALIFAHRLIGHIERATVKKWVEENGQVGFDRIEDLRRLKRGECFVWNPSVGEQLEFSRIQVGERRTYGAASATPTFGSSKRVDPKPLSTRALEEIRGAMAEMVAKVENDDPRLLRQRIAKLEAQLAAAPKVVQSTEPVEVEVEKIVEIKVPILDEKGSQLVRDCLSRLSVDIAELKAANDTLQAAVSSAIAATSAPLPRKPGPPPPRPIQLRPRSLSVSAPPAPKPSSVRQDGEPRPLNAKQIAMLGSVRANLHRAVTKKLISIHAVIPQSGHFNNLFYDLTGRGLLGKVSNSDFTITPKGVEVLNASNYQAPPDLVEAWTSFFKEKLSAKSVAVFEAVAHSKVPLSKSDIAEFIGVPQSGHFNNVFYAVTGNQVFDKVGNNFTLAKEFA